ncbi:MAG: DUF4350 domain-containing protein [Bacteroidota bacterium]
MKKTLLYIGIGLFLGALVVVIYSRSPKRFDGRISFRRTDKIPYGSFTAYEMLQKEFPASTVAVNKYAPVYWKDINSDSPGQALIIVTSYFDPSETDLDYLTGFAQKGNTVLISALYMNRIARKFFRVRQRELYKPGNLVRAKGLSLNDSLIVELDSNVFASPHHFEYPGIPYDNVFDSTNEMYAYKLGYDKDSVPDFLAIDAQKGTILLHAAPITFTNLFLLYKGNYSYYRNILSQISPKTKKIYWDEYFLYNGASSGKNDGKGLLSVIFQYPAFKYAFWATLLLLGMYLVTEVKRKQRMVEAHPRPVNDSLNFVSTISNLYYDKGDHHNLAEKLTYLFLDYVRTRYKIPTNELNSSFEHVLSLRSSVPLPEIEQLVEFVKYVQFEQTITAKQLMDYHILLENFYKQA